MEFPTDTNTFSLGNQFMWGDSYLVAPKLGEPVKFSAAMNGIYNITVYLPAEAEWYLQQNKQVIAGSSEMQSVIVGDLEYATFVKAGSIIPILNVGKDRMSLSQAINDNIRIEVYPTSGNQASGMLYIDDYTSHQYTSGAYSCVEYNFDGTKLSVQKAIEDAAYYKASNKFINEISVMNVGATP